MTARALPLLSAEIFRLTRQRQTIVLAAVMVVAIAFAYVAFWLLPSLAGSEASAPGGSAADVQQLRDSLRLRFVVPFGFGLSGAISVILGSILVGSSIGGDYAWGTVRSAVAYAGGRAGLLFARIGALVLLLAGGLSLGFLTAMLLSAAYTLAHGGGAEGVLSIAFAGHVIAALARTVYSILPYVLLALAVSIVTRSSAAGIGLPIAVYVTETLGIRLLDLFGGTLSRIGDALIIRNAGAVLSGNGRVGGGSAPVQPNVWRAVAILAAYDTLFILAALRTFLRRDITD